MLHKQNRMIQSLVMQPMMFTVTMLIGASIGGCGAYLFDVLLQAIGLGGASVFSAGAAGVIAFYLFIVLVTRKK